MLSIVLKMLWAVCCTARAARTVRVLNLSNRLVPYKEAWARQASLTKHQIVLQDGDAGGCEGSPVGHVLLLQHESVYTLGTTSHAGSGPFGSTTADGDELAYDLFETERAGQATYHGPGQLVMYPDPGPHALREGHQCGTPLLPRPHNPAIP